MEKRDELVTIDGIVDGDAAGQAVVVDAVLAVADAELPVELRRTFHVRTNDGRRDEIELAKHPVVHPVRKASGPWSEIEQHAVRPTGDFAPDMHVKVRGAWISPGEPISVIGYAKEHDFVPDTG